MLFVTTTFGRTLLQNTAPPPVLRYVLGTGFGYTPTAASGGLVGSPVIQGLTTGVVDTRGGYPSYSIDFDASALGGLSFGEAALYLGADLIAVGANQTAYNALSGLVAIEANLDDSATESPVDIGRSESLQFKPTLAALPKASLANPNIFGVVDRSLVAVTKNSEGVWELAGGLYVGTHEVTTGSSNTLSLNFENIPLPSAGTKVYLSARSGRNKGYVREGAVTSTSSQLIVVTLTSSLQFSVDPTDEFDVYYADVASLIANPTTFDPSLVAITGGSINGTSIGLVTPAAGRFTSLNTTGTTSLGSTSATSLDSTPIGATIPATGAFTTLATSGQTTLGPVSAASINATPIGLTTPAAANVTTLTAEGSAALEGNVQLGTDADNSVTVNSPLLLEGNTPGLNGQLLGSAGPNERPVWVTVPNEQVATTPPVARSNGQALQEGDRYWNSSLKILFSWNNTASQWQEVGGGSSGPVVDLTVSGNTILGNSTTDALTVNATAQFEAPVTVDNNLGVSGNTTLGTDGNNTLNVNSTVVVGGSPGAADQVLSSRGATQSPVWKTVPDFQTSEIAPTVRSTSRPLVTGDFWWKPSTRELSVFNTTGNAWVAPTAAQIAATSGSINGVSIGFVDPESAVFVNLEAQDTVTLGTTSADTMTVNSTATFNSPVSANANVALGSSAAEDSVTLNATLSTNSSVGAAGQVLKSRGAAQSPTWSSVPDEQVATTAPTVRSNGQALQEGDRYWNSTTNVLQVWDAVGLRWVSPVGYEEPTPISLSTRQNVMGGVRPFANSNASSGIVGVRTSFNKWEAETAYTGVRLWLGSREGLGPSGPVQAIVAATETALRDTAVNAFEPRFGGASYNTILTNPPAPAPIKGWMQATFKDSQFSTIPAACFPPKGRRLGGNNALVNGLYGNNSQVSNFLCTDIIPLVSVPRTDGGLRPLLLTRVHVNGGRISTISSTNIELYNTQTAEPFYRLMHAATTSNDGVGTLSNVPASPSLDTGSLYVWPEFIYDKPVRSLLIADDSRGSSNYKGKGLGPWGYEGALELSTPSAPVCPVVAGGSSHTQDEFLTMLINLISGGHSVTDILIPCWSQNGAISSEIGGDVIIGRLTDLLKTAKQYGVRVFLHTSYGLSGIIQGADLQERARIATINWARSVADNRSVVLVDTDAAITDYTPNGYGVTKGRIRAEYNGDVIHTNGLGTDVQKEVFKASWLGAR